MSRGKNATKEALKKLRSLGNDATVGDKNLMTVLEMANEALERGIKFSMVDLYKSEANEWVIEDDTLIPPFSAVPSLGDNVAKQIIVDYLTRNSALDGMPDENQLSLLDF